MLFVSDFGFQIFMSLKILFLGDIVGKLARKALAQELSQIKKEHKPDLIIANAENSAHGLGISKKIYDELRTYGIDFMTLGDHAFDKEEASGFLDTEKANIIRPYNFPQGVGGAGESIVEVGSRKILVINLLGRVFMKMDYDCPFRSLDSILEKHKNEKFAAIIVDMHAEATSEKVAMGWYLDGRVSAVLGTHTHVQTADEKILSGGTAYITDVGMTGPSNSVIGIRKELALEKFLTKMPKKFEMAGGEGQFNGVVVDIDENSGRANGIKRLQLT